MNVGRFLHHAGPFLARHQVVRMIRARCSSGWPVHPAGPMTALRSTAPPQRARPRCLPPTSRAEPGTLRLLSCTCPASRELPQRQIEHSRARARRAKARSSRVPIDGSAAHVVSQHTRLSSSAWAPRSGVSRRARGRAHGHPLPPATRAGTAHRRGQPRATIPARQRHEGAPTSGVSRRSRRAVTRGPTSCCPSPGAPCGPLRSSRLPWRRSHPSDPSDGGPARIHR